MRAQTLKNVEIREDNILEVACFRFLSLEDSFESKYKHLLRYRNKLFSKLSINFVFDSNICFINPNLMLVFKILTTMIFLKENVALELK